MLCPKFTNEKQICQSFFTFYSEYNCIDAKHLQKLTNLASIFVKFIVSNLPYLSPKKKKKSALTTNFPFNPKLLRNKNQDHLLSVHSASLFSKPIVRTIIYQTDTGMDHSRQTSL